MVIIKREEVFVDQNGNLLERPYFVETAKERAIRFAIYSGIITSFFLFMLIGYVHAKSRLKKGLKPLAYHRWLLSRDQRAIHEPRFRYPPAPYFSMYRPQEHGMNNADGSYPPPVYGHDAPPPTYQPPPGATKVDPSQWGAQPTRRPREEDDIPGYAPPSGPPPAQLRPERTGETNPFRG